MAATRHVIVEIKLKDAFVFRHMRGREALSELFDYQVELLSEDDSIRLEDVSCPTMTAAFRILWRSWSASVISHRLCYRPSTRNLAPSCTDGWR